MTPVTLNQFEFIEMSATNPHALDEFLTNMGFAVIASDRTNQIDLYQQGNARIIANHDPYSIAKELAHKRAPFSFTAMGLSCDNLQKSLDHLKSMDAPFIQTDNALPLPGLTSLGETVIYLLDSNNPEDFFSSFFSLKKENESTNQSSVGLILIDHLTGHVPQGELDQWHAFFTTFFDLDIVYDYPIDFNKTHYRFSALQSKNGKIRLPVNEATDDISTVAEFLRMDHGAGYQHVAFQTQDIYNAVEALMKQGIHFMNMPDTYYDLLEERFPGHKESLSDLKRLQISVDGRRNEEGNYDLLLQIFTKMMIKPIFFEVIQRKNFDGFGEGNTVALSKALELDQMQRGVL